MRIALLHNPSAGSEDHTDAELTEMIQSFGHEVEFVVPQVTELTAGLQRAACDLVVVAGGDGTVGEAACELAGWQIPLAILPLGTANNTARSLDLPRRLKKLVARWKHAALVPFDLAFLDDGAVRLRFAEVAGWGSFADTIARAKGSRTPKAPRKALGRARRLFSAAVEVGPCRFYEICVDGRDCSGEYLLVEIVNVPFIGPQLRISPDSHPGDGFLEVVLAGETDRGALGALAEGGGKSSVSLRRERGRRITVRARDGLLHRDGSLLRHPTLPRSFVLSIEPAAVHYLV